MDMNLSEKLRMLMEDDLSDADVQYQIALCYLGGEDGNVDRKSAEVWLRRAAEQGHQLAIEMLPSADEPPTVQDTINDQNLADYCLLAEEGNASAQLLLAQYFVERAPSESARYLDLAVRQGEPQACLQLARLHIDSPEFQMSQDLRDTTLRLLKNAADCGLPEAMFLLGDCYAEGYFGAEHCHEAEGWFLKSAEQGTPGEKLQLAICYGTGNKVQMSLGQAFAWAKRAQNEGLSDAQEQLRQGIAQYEAEQAARQEMERLRLEAQEAEQLRMEQEALRIEQEREAEALRIEQAQEEEARRIEREREAEAIRRYEAAEEARIHREQEEEERYQQELRDSRKPTKRIGNIFKSIWGAYMELKERSVVIFVIVNLLIFCYVIIPLISIPIRIGLVAALSSIESVVEDTTLESIDPFEFLDITYSGAQPNASMEIYNNTTSAVMGGFVYTATPSAGLSNGDEVVISVSYDKDSLKDAGYTLSSTSTTFTVEDVPAYAADISEIDDACVQDMEEQALDTLTSYLQNTSAEDICENLFNASLSLVFDGLYYSIDRTQTSLATTYFLAVKDGYEDSSIANRYTLVYQIPVEATSGKYSHNDLAYFAITFTNIINDEAGVSSVKLTDEKTVAVSTTLDVVENEVASAYKEKYVVTQTFPID